MPPPYRVWITRSREGAAATAARLSDLGYEPLVSPLVTIEAMNRPIDLEGVTRLAFTSQRAVEVFASLSARRDLPVLAVGDATASCAREAGFADVRSARGDVEDLAELIRSEPSEGLLLWPRGREAARDLVEMVGDAIKARSEVVYAQNWGMQGFRRAADGRIDAVLFHSRGAADRFAERLDAYDLAGRLGEMTAVAMSARVAEPLRDLDFAQLAVAATPDEPALLDALGKARPPV